MIRNDNARNDNIRFTKKKNDVWRVIVFKNPDMLTNCKSEYAIVLVCKPEYKNV